MAIDIGVGSDASVVGVSVTGGNSGIAISSICDSDIDLSVAPCETLVQLDESSQCYTVDLSTETMPTIYGGPYSVVPGDTDQVLSTAGKTMTGDITVEKIPSNYGKIGWNGFRLTVT